jgi:hypothetical protein
VPYRIAAMAAFTSYSIGHNLGATVFTGGAIRFRITPPMGSTSSMSPRSPSSPGSPSGSAMPSCSDSGWRSRRRRQARSTGCRHPSIRQSAFSSCS